MRILHLAATSLFALGLAACSPADISSAEAHALVEAGATLIDVRTNEEWDKGHIPGAKHIPVHQIGKRLAELGDKGEPIVLYCHSGKRASRAQAILREAGFGKVHNVGGMDDW